MVEKLFKTIYGYVFKNVWGVLILAQVMFFGGGFVSSTPANEFGLAKLVVGFVWFGSFALWAWGKTSGWDKE